MHEEGTVLFQSGLPINDDHSVTYQVYLDLVQFEVPYGPLNFFKRSNKTLAISRKNWSKPALGLNNRSQMKGHLYYLGKFDNKYDIHIVFRPKDDICDCRSTQKELHVSTSVSYCIASKIDTLLYQCCPALTGYYQSNSNLYLNESTRTFYVAAHDLIEWEMRVLTGDPFFESHEAKMFVSCLGQNDSLVETSSVYKELDSIFELSFADSLRFSIAIGVSVSDRVLNEPMSVVLSKTNMADIHQDEHKHYRKCFNEEFCNFQGSSIPISILEEIDFKLAEAEILLDYVGEKINFYNGKRNSYHSF
jgi:hypothetical protein